MSVQNVVDNVRSRKKPLEEYTDEQIEVVKKAVEYLGELNIPLTLNRLHRTAMDIGIRAYGFSTFIYEIYEGIGNPKDIQYVAEEILKIKLEENGKTEEQENDLEPLSQS